MAEKKRPLFFYGWVIVAICFLTVAVAYGIRYSFSVFYVSILQEFGWSRADTALIFSINIIVYGVSAPFVGIAVDRLGPRKFMAAGAVLLAVATAACSLASQIWQFYLVFGVLTSFGIGGSISPWLGGKIFDVLGTYVPAFIIVIAALAAAAICIWIAAPRRVRLVAGKVPKMARETLIEKITTAK